MPISCEFHLLALTDDPLDCEAFGADALAAGFASTLAVTTAFVGAAFSFFSFFGRGLGFSTGLLRLLHRLVLPTGFACGNGMTTSGAIAATISGTTSSSGGGWSSCSAVAVSTGAVSSG